MNRNPTEPGCPKTRFQLNTGDYVSGIGHTVVLKARDDLFDPSTGDEIVCADGTKLPGLQLFTHNEVTAIPDNVGCCEIVSVGELVQNVKPGDVVFIDFFDVRQGAILGDPEALKGREVYIANDDAFKAFFDPVSGIPTPMPGYVITKRANERMAIALNGTDRVHIPPSTLTDGLVSGRTQDGRPAAHVIYEEVVSVGAPAFESKLRPMTKAERALLDEICSPARLAHTREEKKRRAPLKREDWEYLCEYDGYGAEEARLVDDVIWERSAPRELDIEPGALVAFSTDFAVQIRVRGEFMRIVPQSALLCTVNDERIRDEAIRSGRSGQIVRVA